MNASDLFKTGKLAEAIDAQVQAVKASPADHGRRVFLYELLAFAGDLDRAHKHLDAVRYDDPEVDATVQGYRQLLDAEGRRRALFRDGTAPQFLVPAPEHVARRLEAVAALRAGEPARAAEALARATAARPAVRGVLNGKPFADLRDVDDLFAGVLEVMSQGSYYWLALEQIDLVAINPPKYPRDLLWVPARLEVRDGPAGGVFLPTLYPGSHEHPDERVKLGRMTDWKADDGGPIRGAGLHTFLAGDDEIGLLEWRQLEVQPGGASS